MKTKKAKKGFTLGDMAKAAHKAGATVTVELSDRRMPLRLPDDPEHVTMLLDEAERVGKLGNNWLAANVPNPVAADMLFKHGWAFALAAAWLRCKLKGEVGPDKK